MFCPPCELLTYAASDWLSSRGFPVSELPGSGLGMRVVAPPTARVSAPATLRAAGCERAQCGSSSPPVSQL